MSKIFFCCTIPDTFSFSVSTIKKLIEEGHEVTLVSSDADNLSATADRLGVNCQYVNMSRSMSPLKDIEGLIKLWWYFVRKRPDMVIGATPKAALLSMLASRCAFIRNRIYHIYGLPYETAKGKKLKLLLLIEKITGACANVIVPIGTSVKESTKSHRLYKASKYIQPALLTVGGVDTSRFDPGKLSSVRTSLKKEIGIPEDKKVIGYVARLTADKGFQDVIEVWSKIKGRGDVCMLIVGDPDERCPINRNLSEDIFNDPNVFHIGFTQEVEKYFSIMDIFFFPSHREGFGNVNLEAAAMEIPVITYNVTGCKDAVSDGENGYVVTFRDYGKITELLNYLLDNPKEAKALGCRGRKRIEELFTRKKVAESFSQMIKEILGE